MLTSVKSKIPINEKNKDFFEIIVDENFCSINIFFNWKQNIEISDLFLILKSYILSKENLIKGVYVIASDNNFIKNNIKPNFFRHLNIKKIEKINFLDFTLLYDDMFENDSNNYLNNFDFYGLSIIFLKESKIWEEKKFYPEYPWQIDFKNNFISENTTNERTQKKEIIKLTKENSILKKKIKNYRLYRKWK